MNNITHNGETHDFMTAAELLGLPLVRRYVDDRAVSKLGYNGDCLVAFVGKPPVMHIVGRFTSPLVLPKSISVTVAKPYADVALFDRLKAQSAPDSAGCWIWTGSYPKSCPFPSGHHGMTRVDGKTDRAHRAMWRAVHGPIPSGKNILHRCDVPKCINPDHLWIGTHQDNMADMIAKGRHVGLKQAAATHCKNGHERNDTNCYVDSRGGRGCRICQRIQGAKYHERQVARGLVKFDTHYEPLMAGCCVRAITKRAIKSSAVVAEVTCKACLVLIKRQSK